MYRSLLGNLLVRRRRYRVVAVNRLDEHVTEFVLEPLGTPLAFAPGQFVFVSFRSSRSTSVHPFELSFERQVFSIRAGESRNQFHPFSITSAPDEPTLRITVKAVGDYTRALRLLEAGAEAVVEGPYGSFSRGTGREPRQIWIAGGIGVTPFLSMARSLERSRAGGRLLLLRRAREEAHFLDELRSIVRERDDFRMVARAARDGRLPDAAAARRGERAAHGGRRARLRPARDDRQPPSRSSRRGRLPRDRFHAEEFGFAKIGRARQAEELPPGALRSDPKLLASLAAVAFAGPALALALLIGTYLLARGR